MFLDGGLQQGFELREVARLVDIPHGAKLACTPTVGIDIRIGQDNQGHIVLQLVAVHQDHRLESVHPGHFQIQQDQIEMTLLHQNQRIPAVAGNMDIATAFEFFQCLQRKLGVERMIFNH